MLSAKTPARPRASDDSRFLQLLKRGEFVVCMNDLEDLDKKTWINDDSGL